MIKILLQAKQDQIDYHLNNIKENNFLETLENLFAIIPFVPCRIYHYYRITLQIAKRLENNELFNEVINKQILFLKENNLKYEMFNFLRFLSFCEKMNLFKFDVKINIFSFDKEEFQSEKSFDVKIKKNLESENLDENFIHKMFSQNIENEKIYSEFENKFDIKSDAFIAYYTIKNFNSNKQELIEQILDYFTIFDDFLNASIFYANESEENQIFIRFFLTGLCINKNFFEKLIHFLEEIRISNQKIDISFIDSLLALIFLNYTNEIEKNEIYSQFFKKETYKEIIKICDSLKESQILKKNNFDHKNILSLNLEEFLELTSPSISHFLTYFEIIYEKDNRFFTQKFLKKLKENLENEKRIVYKEVVLEKLREYGIEI